MATLSPRRNMRIEQIEPDILVFVGDEYESVATAFLRNGDVLLVDALASRSDAEWMRRHLEERLGNRAHHPSMPRYAASTPWCR